MTKQEGRSCSENLTEQVFRFPSPHFLHVNNIEQVWRRMEISQKTPDDVVITLSIRTALCKSKTGGLKDTPFDGMLFRILQQAIEKSNIDPCLVEDICLGNVT
jgi:hypothetical protein